MVYDFEFEMARAQKLSEKRQYLDAIVVYSALIENAAHSYQVFNKRAHAYAMSGDWKKAIEDIDAAITLNPNEPAFCFSRARWLLQGQQFLESISDLNRLIELEKIHNDTYYLESAYFFRALAYRYLNSPIEVINDCANVSEDFSLYALNGVQSRKDLVSWANEVLSEG
ncbi:MAG TPA: tetratricopeptide repeat protein [Spongiibacteraceae bacterium]|nr:tetratricopeptide repeat protein [Spongiibacteraceae bacterium]